MTIFNSPKRRATRQRAGYVVSGTKSGNEALVVTTCGYTIDSPFLELLFRRDNVVLLPQFEEELGLVAIGGYLKAATPLHLVYTVQVYDSLTQSLIQEKIEAKSLPAHTWQKFGTHLELDNPTAYNTVDLCGKITIHSLDGTSIGSTSFWNINLDGITVYAKSSVAEDFSPQALIHFREKTYLYYPEICYWPQQESFTLEPISSQGTYIIGSGEQLILKSCNRCARFLPIDIADERNNLGFSNHCISRAPCQHNAFSSFTLENWNPSVKLTDTLARSTTVRQDTLIVKAHFGFQLECRPCKKFKVNAPLNPLRNTAQRREDSLRRRAFEVLLRELLEKDWIFYKFRREKREEFDLYIWNKFDKKCFACGKALPTPKDMDLDHTFPLLYLWPLDEWATCLCSTCNSQKHERFPFEFERYQEPGKLERLAKLTNIPTSLLLERRRIVNPVALTKLREKTIWFFDEFLARPDYQKIRQGKKAADLILASLQRVLDECKTGLDLVQEYKRQSSRFPMTVTIH